MKAFNLKAFMRKALLKRQSRYFWTESPKIVIVQFWGSLGNGIYTLFFMVYSRGYSLTERQSDQLPDHFA